MRHLQSHLLLATCLLASQVLPAAAASQQPLFDVPRAPSPTRSSPLVELHKSLVEIPSLTGSEHNVTAFLHTHLTALGLTVETQPVTPSRANILAYLGPSRASRILLTSHLDTVPPFLPYRRLNSTLYGRGSVDAKASVAAQIGAFSGLARSGAIRAGDVALLFVVGEERGGAGMRAANDLRLAWEAVVFGEPTERRLGRGHKGGIGFTLTAHGRAAHSGYPERGRNAIDALVRALAALQRVDWPSSEAFGETTLNVGEIHGGVAPNVVPERASARAAVRIAAGEPQLIRRLVRDAVAAATADVEVEFTAGIGPVPIDHDVEGFETAVLNYGTDIPNLHGAHKRYLYGPGTILVAHSPDEHVELGDLEEAVEGYKLLIREILKRKVGAP
ncbi:hypothetical protein A9K55_001239 [Cordyceps militaris]|uniref:Peptidase M20 dimerisation domain-containing protein n=1 Tax=Cordyceps militaris TaxID=73501 RepID=A0A2H4SQH0_CORMI|nr:hypothetical protein A9K55_001239 [Cordyceps militaris]